MAGTPTAAGEEPAVAGRTEQPPHAGTDPAPATPAKDRPAHGPLRRYPDRGLLAGVGAGVAEHFEVDVLLVRVAMALILVAGGVGVVFYALAWALIPVAPESQGVRRPRGAWREALAIVVIVAAVLFGLRRAGLLIGDSFIWPLVLGAAGVALVWRPIVAGTTAGPSGRRPTPRELLRRLGQADLPRLVIGLLLVALASASVLHSLGVLHNLGAAIGAVAIVVTMLGLLFGPWFVRLLRNLSSERAARIRDQERAEVAAHLHDSVLQTLALIQKRAGDPREVAGLARRQERELRNWLHERPETRGQESFATALGRTAAEAEELHGVPVEVVTVGDRPMDQGLEAMVQAAREAMINAARFAGAERIDLYAEVGADRVQMFVRDRGVGFDPATIPADRRGVRDSIIGRMHRHHGRATVQSTPGEGTEVELVIEGHAQ